MCTRRTRRRRAQLLLLALRHNEASIEGCKILPLLTDMLKLPVTIIREQENQVQSALTSQSSGLKTKEYLRLAFSHACHLANPPGGTGYQCSHVAVLLLPYRPNLLVLLPDVPPCPPATAPAMIKCKGHSPPIVGTWPNANSLGRWLARLEYRSHTSRRQYRWRSCK